MLHENVMTIYLFKIALLRNFNKPASFDILNFNFKFKATFFQNITTQI